MKAEDISLRPQYLNQYKGQVTAVKQLDVMIKAAKQRNEGLGHILVTGPGGLGKTTLADCIANEMGTAVKKVTAMNLTSLDDLRNILIGMGRGEILFIDEIHALTIPMIETLYTVMEDFYYDHVATFRGATTTVRIEIPTFTLIGATTNPEKLTPSLRTRFARTIVLDYMSAEDLAVVVYVSGNRLGLTMTTAGAVAIGLRSRGIPRVANQLLKAVRDHAEVYHNGVVDGGVVSEAMELLQIDERGLEEADRKLLRTIARNGNKPMGIAALASALRESKEVIEGIREPFLVEQGLIERTSKGRIVTEAGLEIING
jgi:Holliday junction DNA helicase RuvB